jgi:RNAse (barnase) inhibitor barstar
MAAPVCIFTRLAPRHSGREFCESVKPEIIIDATQFSDLAGLANYLSEVALKGQHRWNGNLDAFNDILRGGFGTPDGGFTIVWRNHQKSRQELAQTFDILLEIIRVHGPGGEEAGDHVDLRLE